MIFKLAWRNIWRHKRRTWITLSAISIGISMLMFMDGFMRGMMEHMIETSTLEFKGQFQLHQKDYIALDDVNLKLVDHEKQLSLLKSSAHIKTLTTRVYLDGMLAIGDRFSPVRLCGVDLNSELQTVRWPKQLIAGELPENGKPWVIIGKKLAKQLDVADW